MIIERMTTQVLHVILSALTPTQRWGAARHSLGASSAVEGWLTVFAIAALVTAIILVIWLISEHRRSIERLQREITGLGLTAAIDELRLIIANLGQETPTEVSVVTEPMPTEESEQVQESEELVAIGLVA
jgi:hypothetical protein